MSAIKELFKRIRGRVFYVCDLDPFADAAEVELKELEWQISNLDDVAYTRADRIRELERQVATSARDVVLARQQLAEREQADAELREAFRDWQRAPEASYGHASNAFEDAFEHWAAKGGGK